MIFYLPCFFSESDIALVLKYTFHDGNPGDDDDETTVKKRKTGDIKRNNVLDYSKLKLPAVMFGFYLNHDCQGFIDDCAR